MNDVAHALPRTDSEAGSPPTVYLSIQQIDRFDKNPRRTRNERYEEIRASVLARRRLDDYPTVTLDPTTGRYVTAAGGGTRLDVLQDLFNEIGHSDFEFGHWPVVPWPGRYRLVLAHATENVLRSDPVFIDIAQSAVDAIEELAKDDSSILAASVRDQARRLTADGWPMNHQDLGLYLYAVHRLWPVMPIALHEVPVTKTQARRIRQIDSETAELYRRSDETLYEGYPERFDALLREQDGPEFVVDRLSEIVAKWLRNDLNYPPRKKKRKPPPRRSSAQRPSSTPATDSVVTPLASATDGATARGREPLPLRRRSDGSTVVVHTSGGWLDLHGVRNDGAKLALELVTLTEILPSYVFCADRWLGFGMASPDASGLDADDVSLLRLGAFLGLYHRFWIAALIEHRAKIAPERGTHEMDRLLTESVPKEIAQSDSFREARMLEVQYRMVELTDRARRGALSGNERRVVELLDGVEEMGRAHAELAAAAGGATTEDGGGQR